MNSGELPSPPPGEVPPITIGILVLKPADPTFFSNTQPSRRRTSIINALIDEILARKNEVPTGYRESMQAYFEQQPGKVGQFVAAKLRGDERSCIDLLRLFNTEASRCRLNQVKISESFPCFTASSISIAILSPKLISFP